MIRRLFIIVASVAVLASGFSFLLPTAVHADASSFCRSKYRDAASPSYRACETGYKYGDQKNPVCGNQFELPVEYPTGSGKFTQPKDLQDACVAGYQQWVNDDNACNNNAPCKKDLRPDGNSPLTQGADPSQRRPDEVGPIPRTADISTMQDDESMDHAECGMESFFGEILCDISKTAAHIADASFWLLSIFLKVPPLISGSQGDSADIYNAWANMRNIANVLFVFAFIVVIYSQLTGMGLSNYNIKKMIPRLIVAALLINISFYICALAVDLANVLGATLAETMTAIVPPAPNPDEGLETWQKIIGSTILLTGPVIAAGAAMLFLDLAAIIPVLATVLIVLAITLVILIMRQALIIVLVIVSPLAMAALILPGTRQWFDRWRKIFFPIVMLYPSIAFVYGGSQIASQIIRDVGAANNNAIMAIASLGIQVVPLALTPMLMKLGGGMMSRYLGVMQNSSPVGKFKQKADDYAKYRGSVRINKALNRKDGGKIRNFKNRATKPRDDALKRKLTKQAARSNVDLVHGSAMEDYAIDAMNKTNRDEDISAVERAKQLASGGKYQAKTEGDKFAEQVAATKDRDSVAKAKAHTINMKVQAHAKKVEAQALALNRNGVSGDQLTQMAMQGIVNGQQVSEIQREAAILRIAQMGDVAGIVNLIKISGQGGQGTDANGNAINFPPLTVNQRQQLVTAMQASGGAVRKAPFLANGSAADNIRQGFVTGDNFNQTVVGNSIAEDDISPESLTTLDGNGGGALVAAAATETRDEDVNDPADANYDSSKPIIKRQTKEANEDLQKAALEAVLNPRTDSAITGGREAIGQLANMARSQNTQSTQEEAIVQNSLYNMEQRDRGSS